jgi:TonB family protein
MGTGAGTGPGTGTGRGTAPEPKQIIMPPPEDRPGELRGVSLQVTFEVDATGRVERVQVEPEIRDRGYAKKFLEVMRKYQFRPARDPGGAPVPGVAVIVVTL